MAGRRKESRGRDGKICGDVSTVLNKAVRGRLVKKGTVEEKVPQKLRKGTRHVAAVETREAEGAVDTTEAGARQAGSRRVEEAQVAGRGRSHQRIWSRERTRPCIKRTLCRLPCEEQTGAG